MVFDRIGGVFGRVLHGGRKVADSAVRTGTGVAVQVGTNVGRHAATGTVNALRRSGALDRAMDRISNQLGDSLADGVRRAATNVESVDMRIYFRDGSRAASQAGRAVQPPAVQPRTDDIVVVPERIQAGPPPGMFNPRQPMPGRWSGPGFHT